MLFVTSALLLAGCGGSANAKVSGKITTKGEAVKSGNLVFSPLDGGESQGKPFSTKVDGGTFAVPDNVRSGKYRITFTPSEPEITEEQRSNPKFNPPPPPYAGMAPKDAQVDIKSGDNTIDVELVSAPPRK